MSNSFKQWMSSLEAWFLLAWLVLTAAVACDSPTPAEAPTKEETVVATINIVDTALASAMTEKDPSKEELETKWKPLVAKVDEARILYTLQADNKCPIVADLRAVVTTIDCAACTSSVNDLGKALGCK